MFMRERGPQLSNQYLGNLGIKKKQCIAFCTRGISLSARQSPNCVASRDRSVLPLQFCITCLQQQITTAHSAFHKYNPTVSTSCQKKTKTHTVQAPWQRKAGSLNTEISSSDKWSQRAHTALPGPDSRKHFPYCCSEKGQLISSLGLNYCTGIRQKAWLRSPSLESDPLLIACTRAAALHTRQHSSLPAQLWLAVLSAAMPSEVRGLTVSNSLCSGSHPTQNYILKLSEKAQIPTAEFVISFSRGSFWAFKKYQDHIFITSQINSFTILMGRDKNDTSFYCSCLHLHG